MPRTPSPERLMKLYEHPAAPNPRFVHAVGRIASAILQPRIVEEAGALDTLAGIKAKSPLVIVSTHPKQIDPITLEAAAHQTVLSERQEDIYPLAKSELFVGLGRFAMHLAGAIPVDREGSNLAVARGLLRRSQQVLGQGGSLLVFPEGTCAPGDGSSLGPLQLGVRSLVSMARKHDGWVLPVAPYYGPNGSWQSPIVAFGNPYEATDSLNERNKFMEDLKARLTGVLKLAVDEY